MCGSAAAQTISDTELRAGYCLGVSTSQAEWERAKLESDPSLRNMPADVLGIIEERQKRFQDYLTVKGVAKDRNPEALRIASECGKKDLATCETELEQFYKECAESCEKVEDESYPACYDKCPHPDSCTRVGKCEKFSSVLKPDHCSLLFLSSRAVRRCSMGLFALFSEALTPALHHIARSEGNATRGFLIRSLRFFLVCRHAGRHMVMHGDVSPILPGYARGEVIWRSITKHHHTSPYLMA